ncbi:AAA family ATPase [Succinatimonas hippei]|uniref:ParA family protein n=1 Tax=Succinatimonas hippei TaxID=626938 RepID=UPI002013762E|nr:AAA family ATPase [Succinatimonas hippei]MCL1603901.1 AAA family ATPase [Succinatimonas hippei]
MKTIAIANRKGGVGKSTTASALSAGLQKKGYRVLTIDLDAQRNLSTTLKAKTDAKTVLGVITGEITAKEAIQHMENGDVIAASKGLSGADLIITETGKEYRLKEALESVSDIYDFCIIDCPPALNILTINALVAADGVLIPAQADLYSLEGIKDLSEVMQPVIKYCNANLKIYGILLTRYSSRSVLSKDATTLAKRLAEQLKTIVFTTTIREAVAVKEAQISQKSLFDYAPNANVTMDYKIFIDEFLQRI